MILNAVLCVWNEEDIIESTVKHLFAQGCSNVYIVDNASTDNTVEIAIHAGAQLANSFESKYFNEFEKVAHLNSVVKKYNEQSNEDSIWWLYVDADEFPNIDSDLTILDFLQQLDISVRAVHGYLFDHIPTHQPYHVQGYHPIDFQQLCTKSHTSKIPLLRYDKNTPHLYSAGGAHSFDTCGETIVVAKDILNIHHFNYRKQESTLRRLKQLRMSVDGTSRLDLLDKRVQKSNINSKSMYHERYERAKYVYDENKYTILMIDELIYSYTAITRWYNPYEISIYDEMLLNQAMHNYFLQNNDIALFKFNDVLKTVNDSTLQMLLTVKIALCLYSTDKNGALFILQPLLKCPDIEIRAYAEKSLLKITHDEVTPITKAKKKFLVEAHCSHVKYKFFI